MACAAPCTLDNRQLTREQLGNEVEQRVGTWATEASFPAFGGHWPRWEIALHEAGLQGIVLFGPSQGKARARLNVSRRFSRLLRRFVSPMLSPGVTCDTRVYSTLLAA